MCFRESTLGECGQRLWNAPKHSVSLRSQVVNLNMVKDVETSLQWDRRFSCPVKLSVSISKPTMSQSQISSDDAVLLLIADSLCKQDPFLSSNFCRFVVSEAGMDR